MAGVQAETMETGSGREAGAVRELLFDTAGIDLEQRLLNREDLQEWIPHRGAMQLLDSIVWVSEDSTRGIGHRVVKADEFWVEGHFPNRPMFPGVLMVETAAQLALYLFNRRVGKGKIPAFLRIEDCAFRQSISPGSEFFVLCQEIKKGKRRFVSNVQGLVDDQVAFEARLTGMSLGELEQ